MENILKVPQKSKHRITIWFSKSICEYIQKRIKSKDSSSHLYTRIHSSIIYSNQKVEAILSISRWYKQNAVSIDNAIFFSSEGKVSACSAGDPGSIPASGRSPGEGNGNLFQYSCLENPWREEPGRLQSMGLQRVGLDWATSLTQEWKMGENINYHVSKYSSQLFHMWTASIRMVWSWPVIIQD